VGPPVEYTDTQPIQTKKTHPWLSHYVIQTVEFVNRFSTVCEQKLSEVCCSPGVGQEKKKWMEDLIDNRVFVDVATTRATGDYHVVPRGQAQLDPRPGGRGAAAVDVEVGLFFFPLLFLFIHTHEK